MNSLLQTLFMTPEFTYYLYGLEFPPELQTPTNLLYQLQRLFAHMALTKKTSVLTKDLTKSFGWDDREGHVQQDVQELNRVLFDAIQKYLDRSPTPTTQFLTAFFEGEISNYIQCMHCNATRCRYEKFQDASLAIRGLRSLEECLDKFVEVEVLNEGNQVYCEHCKAQRDCKKGTSFHTFPVIFTVQLRRIDFNYTSFTREKLHDFIKIPLEVDFSKWQTESERDGPLFYDLYAVICQRGTAYHGHYFVYVLDQGKWVKFDDETVTIADAEEIQSILDPESVGAEEESSGGLKVSVEGPAQEYGPQLSGEDENFITSLFDEGVPVTGSSDAPKSKKRNTVKAHSYYTVYRKRGTEGSYLPSVPPHLAEHIMKENLEWDLQVTELEVLEELCEVAVFHKGVKTWIEAKHTTTIHDLTRMIYQTLEDVSCTTSFENVRLREYNIALGVAGRSLDGPLLEKTLKELDFRPIQRTVFVDTRSSPAIPWRPYVAEDVAFWLHVYDNSKKEFSPRIRLIVPEDGTLDELYTAAVITTNIPRDDLIVVWKNRDSAVILNESEFPLSALIRKEMKLDYGDTLYAESRKDTATLDEFTASPVNAINTIDATYRCMVMYVFGESPDEKGFPFDSRKTFMDLKNYFSTLLEIPSSEFIIRQHGGREIRDALGRISPYVTAGCINLVVSPGRPLAPDEFRLHFSHQGTPKKPFCSKEYRGVTKVDVVHRDIAETLGVEPNRVRIRLSSTVKGSGCAELIQAFKTVGEMMKGPVLATIATINNEVVLIVLVTPQPEVVTSESLLLTIQPAVLHPEDKLEFLTSTSVAWIRGMTWQEAATVVGSSILPSPASSLVFGKMKQMDIADPTRWPIILKKCTQIHEGLSVKKIAFMPFYLEHDDVLLVFVAPPDRTFHIDSDNSSRGRPVNPIYPGTNDGKPGKEGKKSKKSANAEVGVVIRTEWDVAPPTDDHSKSNEEEPDLDDEGKAISTTPRAAEDPQVDDGLTMCTPQDDAGGNKPGGFIAVSANVNTVKYTDIHSNLDGGRECTICKCDFEEGDECLLLPCYHIYHTACVHEWLTSHRTCPLCSHGID
eukprot:PhF_6_TR31452/c0_g1_i1/m.46153/K11857/USP47; ubiquitin carboxyl-terminal hydrolase 47